MADVPQNLPPVEQEAFRRFQSAKASMIVRVLGRDTVLAHPEDVRRLFGLNGLHGVGYLVEAAEAAVDAAPGGCSCEVEVAALQTEVAALQAEVDQLRAELCGHAAAAAGQSHGGNAVPDCGEGA